MTTARPVSLLLGCALLALTACAQRAPVGAPQPDPPPETGQPPFIPLQPMPSEPPRLPVEGLLGDGELAPEELGVRPMPFELHAFTEALHRLVGDAPEFGGVDVTDRSVVVVRWYGEPPEPVRVLIGEQSDAPFGIRVEPTLFRPADLQAEAGRLLDEHGPVVTMAGPRNEGDGVWVGIDPAVVASPGPADLHRLRITSRFPLFPEAASPAVPAAGG